MYYVHICLIRNCVTWRTSGVAINVRVIPPGAVPEREDEPLTHTHPQHDIPHIHHRRSEQCPQLAELLAAESDDERGHGVVDAVHLEWDPLLAPLRLHREVELLAHAAPARCADTGSDPQGVGEGGREHPSPENTKILPKETLRVLLQKSCEITPCRKRLKYC